jgi:hypothetical protein
MYQQGCESCQKWRDHYTQEHMDVSRVRFFKIMTGDFAQYLVSMLCPLSSMVLRNAIQHLAVKSCGSLVLVLLLDKCYRKRKEKKTLFNIEIVLQLCKQLVLKKKKM